MTEKTLSNEEKLEDLLHMHGISYEKISGDDLKVTDDLAKAVGFLFDVKTPTQTSTVIIGLSGDGILHVFLDSVASKSKQYKAIYDELRRWVKLNGLDIRVDNFDRAKYYLKKRKDEMKNEQNTSLQEGYRALGSQKSIGDHVPQVKIVIEHSRKLREGEQRFRSIDRIFIENTVGERILTPVKEASLARVFARLIAEGDLPHGVRWQHLENLTEDFKKIRDFVRATRGQITENRLVGLGRTHYIELKETLTRLAGHKGYNKYFEGWEPSKDDGSKLNMEKLYETGGDPRILEAMPILYKIQQQAKADEAQYQAIVESRGIARLEAWADSVISDYLYENEQPEESDIEVSAKMPGGGTISTETDLEEGEEAEIFSSGRGSKWDRPEGQPAYRRKNRGEQLDLRDLGIDEPDMPDVGEPDMPDFDGMDIPAYMRKASGKNFPGSIKEEEKMANKDWDGDGQIESEKDEVWGSRAAAAARAGKPFGK